MTILNLMDGMDKHQQVHSKTGQGNGNLCQD